MSLETLRSSGLVRPLTLPAPAGLAFPYGLGRTGLHEMAEAAYGARAAMTGFLCAVMQSAEAGAWIWVQQASFRREEGSVPERALADSPCVLRLTVEARNGREALWAAEEAVVSGAARLVIAEVDEADFTATRRLALASGRHGVPAVLMLPYNCAGPTAAATRWRIGPRPSAPNRYDPHAPGAARWRAVLERCRAAPAATGKAFDLEWTDETLSLSVVSGLATGPAAPRPAAGESILRSRAG
ncbi:ImuA family protein [Hyphomonas sp.]|uniref:ImuA family protein n=1 Tax=Hyphomonas sp. TaxID=87 RepID=UPI00391A010B